jgi:hypothetical protein
MSTYTIVYRNVKGSPLTNSEVDSNFSNLDTYKAPLDSPSFTTLVNSAGPVTVNAGVGSLVLTNGGGSSAASLMIKRVGAPADQKTFEMSQSADGSLQVRTVNDAGSATQSAIGVTRGPGYTLATLQLMPVAGRVLVGVQTDDGANALQVAGNIALSGQLALTSAVSSIELGSTTTSGTPFFDFHSSGNNVSYDSRIYSAGGSATAGSGQLNFMADTHVFTANAVLIGTSTNDSIGKLQVNGNISAAGFFYQTVFGSAAVVRLRSGSGTPTAPAATPTGTQILTIVSSGYDGATFRDMASMETWSEGAVTTTSAPGNIRFRTTPSGSLVPTERMRIAATGRVLINQTTDDGVNQLQVTGGIVAVNNVNGGNGLTLRGATGYSAGFQLFNTTASTGRVYSFSSNAAGNLSINDDVAGAVRLVVLASGRVIVGPNGDDGATLLQVGGALKTTGAITNTSGTLYNYGWSGNTSSAVYCFAQDGSKYILYNAATATFTFAGGEVYVGGSRVWHAGNLNPAAYLPLTGGTLTGPLFVGSTITSTTGALTTQGWGGNTTAGLVYFGAPGNNHYIYFDGSNFNVNGNLLGNGGTVWSSGNLPNPVQTTGATFVGQTVFNAGLVMGNGHPLEFLCSGNTYASFLASRSDGVTGFLNNAQSAWTFTVSDAGNIGVAGYAQINGTVGINTGYGYLTGSGATGAGSTTLPVSVYCPNGRILATEVDAISDRRMKENIESLTLDRALNFVQNVRPVTFTWKNIPEAGTRFGYIAQEVSKAGFNELIGLAPDEGMEETIDEDGFVSPADARMSVNYDQAVPLLQLALNNALERIAALETLIAGKA